jgi:hypothetical protein
VEQCIAETAGHCDVFARTAAQRICVGELRIPTHHLGTPDMPTHKLHGVCVGVAAVVGQRPPDLLQATPLLGRHLNMENKDIISGRRRCVTCIPNTLH